MRKIICFILIFTSIYTSVFAFFDAEDDEIIDVDDIVEVVNNVQSKPNIQATSAILFDRTSKRILFEKDMNKRIPNASTTKILTAIVAYENANMDDIVTISSNAANTGGSKVKLRAGDKLTLNDLMFGLLLRSGNDAAVAIAEHIGGSVEEFCNMMNKKAQQIGALNTHFTSPHGLDDENHYSSAYDLAIIADYALNIPVIANIVSRKSAIIKVNDSSREISNTNEMLSYYSGANGIKTGYTGDAGRCLVTSATRENWQLISVVLGCNTKKQRTLESTQLLNYGFQNFKLVNLCENMQKEFEFNVYKATKKTYKIDIIMECLYPISEDEKSKIDYIYSFNDILEAPIKKGDIVGNIIIKLGDDVIHMFEVKTCENIDRKATFQYFTELLKLLPQID